MDKENRWVFLFLVPSFIGFSLFFIAPFFFSLFYALTDSPLTGNFVGLQNFSGLLASDAFRLAVANSVRFMAVSIPLNMVIPLLIAGVLNENVQNKWLKAIFMSPLVIPSACIAFFFQSVFASNGLVSSLLSVNTDWLKTDSAFAIAVSVYIWKNMGYNLVLFLAGLANIPKDYYEWAGVEGMGKSGMFFHITLVYLTPTLFMVFVMSFINSFKVFREIYMLAGSYPNDKIYMLQHYMNNQFSALNYPSLSAASFLITAVIAGLVMIFFGVNQRSDWEE